MLISRHFAAAWRADAMAQNLMFSTPKPLGMEKDMNVASDFAGCSADELKALLDSGTLTVYSVARPITADRPVDRSGVLATFKFASPAFGPAADGFETPKFAANPVTASVVGTPGFARA